MNYRYFLLVVLVVHKIFFDWIISQKETWDNLGISIEKIINDIVNPELPDFPYVAVHHSTTYGLGQIALHKVYGGYILDFEAGRTDIDSFIAYSFDFTDKPLFNLWQERYITFLCSE